MKILFLLLLWLASDFLHGASFVGDTLELKEVVVTGQRLWNRHAIAQQQSINRVDIDLLTGLTAAEALKSFSGVTIQDYGGLGGLKTVMVRSLGANHTAVFMDGVPLSDAATGQIDLGKIPTEQAEQITLSVGHPASIGKSARYYASGSVLEVQTQTPSLNEKHFRLKTQVKGGSFGLFNPSLAIDNRWNSFITSQLYVDYKQAHGAYPYLLEGEGDPQVLKRKNADLQAMQVQGHVVADLKRLEAKLQFYYYDAERGLPGAVVYYNPHASQRLWNQDGYMALNLQNSNAEKWLWKSQLKYGQMDLHYRDEGFLNSAGLLENNYLQREYYFTQSLSRKLIDSLYVSLAADAIVNTLESNAYEASSLLRYHLMSVLSLQYNRNRFAGHANILLTRVDDVVVNDEDLKNMQTRTFQRASPAVSLSYRLMNRPAVRLQAGYKEIFRMPTFHDLYYAQVGNANLLPEYAKQWNAGLTVDHAIGQWEQLSLSTDVFYNRVEDKIIAVPTKNLFVWSMRNLGLVDIRGFELKMQAVRCSSLGFNTRLDGNYTLQYAMDVTNPESSFFQQQIPYIPFETANAGFSFGYGNWWLRTGFMYRGHRFVLGENTYDNMLPSYWLADVSLLYKVQLQNHTLQIKGEVSNLLNQSYEVIRSFPMPGRCFIFSLAWLYE